MFPVKDWSAKYEDWVRSDTKLRCTVGTVALECKSKCGRKRGSPPCVQIKFNQQDADYINVETCEITEIHRSIWYSTLTQNQLTMVYFRNDGKCFRKTYSFQNGRLTKSLLEDITKTM